MKYLIPLLLLPFALGACTAQNDQYDESKLPSCDLEQQRMLVGATGGSVTDPRQAHIVKRAQVLATDVGNARQAHRISEQQRADISQRIAQVRAQTDDFVKQQGFLSAAQRASFDREFDGIAQRICQPR